MWREARRCGRGLSKWAVPSQATPTPLTAHQRHLVLSPRKTEQKKPQTTCFNGFRFCCCLSAFFLLLFLTARENNDFNNKPGVLLSRGLCTEPEFLGKRLQLSAVFILLGGGVGCVASA